MEVYRNLEAAAKTPFADGDHSPGCKTANREQLAELLPSRPIAEQNGMSCTRHTGA
jgi:hypothetical protein